MALDSTITVGEITIPNTDGTNGQVLKTDGSGNLSWQADLVGAQSLPQLSDVTKADSRVALEKIADIVVDDINYL